MRIPTALAITIVVITAAVTVGLVALGSPARARERRFDDKRVEQVSSIGSAVEDYWRINGRLPTALTELEGDWEYAASIRDPATAQPYEYRVIGSDTYELCATFHQPSKGINRGWRHGAGRDCLKGHAKRQRY